MDVREKKKKAESETTSHAKEETTRFCVRNGNFVLSYVENRIDSLRIDLSKITEVAWTSRRMVVHFVGLS